MPAVKGGRSKQVISLMQSCFVKPIDVIELSHRGRYCAHVTTEILRGLAAGPEIAAVPCGFNPRFFTDGASIMSYENDTAPISENLSLITG